MREPTVERLLADGSLPLLATWHYLLVDGVRLTNAESTLYELCDTPRYVNLFAGTEWADMGEVSPLLVQVDASHPLTRVFLKTGFDAEWGFLLQSTATLDEIANHWRRFITVQHPLGHEVMLRFSDPAVARVLLMNWWMGPDNGFWGPVSAALLPDELEQCWHCIQATAGKHAEGERIQSDRALNDHLVDQLTAADHRQTLRTLTHHLKQYFPQRLALMHRGDTVRSLDQLISKAIENGFTSESALTHWATVFGYHGDVSHRQVAPDFYALLTASNGVNPDDTARQAAMLARQKMTNLHTENSRSES
ncbi:DUF4123 domain-containing protein [Marinobacter sp.]|uniref:DUF4123 domain-containing protein n=1 Tax=Marinobacter sp. TaxID=50741 RepID=UPI001B3E3408|nr:DUF4123 domain-containing protein [Marinobacter sp.]MBQ0832873.1 DUF4123 domain-containing protein [Marinobacter sp.]